MRSPREIIFRLRQEAANALLALSSPNFKLTAESPFPLLPDPAAVGSALRDSEYAQDLIQTAEQVIQGRIPILDKLIECGPQVAWRRDPHRGVETPATYFRRIPYLDLEKSGDHKFIWEINRHQHLVPVAQACVISGREEFARYVFGQLEDWWKENPFQRGINWTSALEVAFRALSWIWIWHLIGDKMPETFRRRFLAELYRHGLHLEYNLSVFFSPNTHLLGEAVALHAIGRLFSKFPRADRWRKLGSEIVQKHMESCVKADGSYFEQSTYYHVYALDMFAFHAALEEAPAPYLDGIARMAEFLASLISTVGDLPFLGDDDGGRFFHPYGPRSRFARASLAVASSLTGKSFFPVAQTDCNEIAAWWLGPERCTPDHASVDQRKSRLFRDTGIVVIRRGPIVALFDAGPFGPGSAGHSHSDTLSLVVSVGDRELLIDSGTFSYMDPEWRSAFRGSSAHNTIRIDGNDQGRSAGPFRWAEKPQVKLLEFATDGGRDYAVATCEYRGFTHKRSVELANNQFSIVDTIEGPAGEHEIEQYWHFADMPNELRPGGWEVPGLAELSIEGGVVEQAWRSRCFGSKEPASVIAVRRRAKLPVTLHASVRVLQPDVES
jgi:hypothetical protein